MKHRRLAGAWPLAWAGAAVAELSQDALRAAGPQAGQIVDLWRLVLFVCTVVFAAVLVATALAVVLALRRRRRAGAAALPGPDVPRRSERVATRAVLTAVSVSTVLLLLLLTASVYTDRALARLPLAGALHVEVTGHQWWWELRYDDPDPSRIFSTANELHLPVGRPVIVTLRSADVIHSFWVPALHGKRDMIPGRTATLQFRADRPGTYRGACAEFCGLQHAWMALDVVVESPERYAAWADRQRSSPPVPDDARLRRGRALFLQDTCAMCHNVQGTSATGRQGPDLTHVGSRARIAAGALGNTPANLVRWIADPQSVKPGSNMPSSTLSPADLEALAAYLGSLQ
jgi:cytochrome c oxidase subunit 2